MGTTITARNSLIEDAVESSRLYGEFWELGVYQGASATLLAEIIKQTRARTLRLFDTFRGFPPPERSECKTEGDMACPLEEVKERLREYRFISYHVGEVPFSLNQVGWRPIALAHIDLMLGKPTEGSIKRIWPQVVRGGSMIFEDWQNVKCPGVTHAIEEAFRSWEIVETGLNQCKVVKQ
jgi:Macrocin-O-methyltransferase (TylF)